jgi:hypothetical protein
MSTGEKASEEFRMVVADHLKKRQATEGAGVIFRLLN